MSFHLAAYTELIDNTANTDVNALTDDVLTILNNHFILRQPMKLIAAWMAAATLSRARFDSPTIRFYGNPYVRPINVAALPANNPNMAWYDEKPIILPAGEELAVQATSGIAMGTERFTALAWLQTMRDPVPAGTPYSVRFTSTTAAVANSWTTLTITLESSLPTGAFAMVGSECQSTNQFAHRWIFDEQIERPGFLSITGLGNRQFWESYRQPFGTMGRFTNVALPRLQVLANGADATHEGYLTLVKL